MRQRRLLARQLATPGLERFDGVLGGNSRQTGFEPRVLGRFGTRQHRPGVPQGVVEIEAQEFNHGEVEMGVKNAIIK